VAILIAKLACPMVRGARMAVKKKLSVAICTMTRSPLYVRIDYLSCEKHLDNQTFFR
jgi:hypothetical protein